MDQPMQTVAVVRGASNADIQAIFRTLVDLWEGQLRLSGVVAEDHGLPDRFCQAGYLRSLATGARFSIFEDLGPGATVCHLDGAGAMSASTAIERDVARGCDLVVLNKFGKLEAAGGSLAGAFRATIAAGLPLLTSVSPAHDGVWRQFADREFAILPADPAAIDLWRRSVLKTAAQSDGPEQ
jgi:hypothetical protein